MTADEVKTFCKAIVAQGAPTVPDMALVRHDASTYNQQHTLYMALRRCRETAQQIVGGGNWFAESMIERCAEINTEAEARAIFEELAGLSEDEQQALRERE